jgi:hypothetical protein
MTPRVDVPVLLIVFNRPDVTRRVVAALRTVRPRTLLVAADGPRAGRVGEAALCAEVLATVRQGVDWDCELVEDVAPENLGCRRRVASALDWALGREDTVIVLEDDCVPHPSFFPYCEELLGRYAEDERIMHIAGANFLFGGRVAHSYYFSRFNFCWGWATWRRAWRCYDGTMSDWPALRAGGLAAAFRDDPRAVAYWTARFDEARDGADSWAFRWTLSMWAQGGLSVVPRVNLISNVGFGVEATHTVSRASALANLPVEALSFPLRHPLQVRQDEEADHWVQRAIYDRTRLGRLRRKVRAVAQFLARSDRLPPWV